MYSPATARPLTTSMAYRTRPLSARTQMMARGPGWRLADGEAHSWQIRVLRCDDPVLTWAHMLRSLRAIIDEHGMRAAVIDLRDAERLAGPALAAAALVFAEFEKRGVRVATVVGPDLIHAARLHRVLSERAAVHGRGFLTEDEALDWVRRSAPPVPPPLRVPDTTPRLRPPRV